MFVDSFLHFDLDMTLTLKCTNVFAFLHVSNQFVTPAVDVFLLSSLTLLSGENCGKSSWKSVKIRPKQWTQSTKHLPESSATVYEFCWGATDIPHESQVYIYQREIQKSITPRAFTFSEFLRLSRSYRLSFGLFCYFCSLSYSCPFSQQFLRTEHRTLSMHRDPGQGKNVIVQFGHKTLLPIWLMFINICYNGCQYCRI